MKFIDLSHPLRQQPSSGAIKSDFAIAPRTTIPADGYNSSKLTISTHYATHLDAPFHFFEDGRTIDQMPLGQFFGPATLIDLGQLEPKTPITRAMFASHAQVFTPGAKVIIRTGWYRMFGDARFVIDLPTMTVDTAEWIASTRIGLLGMDLPTPSTYWKECHHALLARGVEIVIVEGLANLHRLPPNFVFAGFPLSLVGSDGSPIRAVGIIE